MEKNNVMEPLNSYLQTAWIVLSGIILLNVVVYFLSNRRGSIGLMIFSLLLIFPLSLTISSLKKIKGQASKEMAMIEGFCKSNPRFQLNISPQELKNNLTNLEEKYPQYHYEYERKDSKEYILYKNEKFKLFYAEGDGERGRFLYYKNKYSTDASLFIKFIFIDKNNQLVLFTESEAISGVGRGPSEMHMVSWVTSIPDCRGTFSKVSQTLVKEYRKLALEE